MKSGDQIMEIIRHAVRLEMLIAVLFGLRDAPTAVRTQRAMLSRAAGWLLYGHEPLCALADATRSGDVAEEGCTCGAGQEALGVQEALGRSGRAAEEELAEELERLLDI